MFLIRRDPSTTAGVGAAEMTDSERRSSDLFKTGKVIQIDYSDPTAPRVRVGIGDEDDQAEGYIQTGWLPLMGGRAGNGESEWDPPEDGEIVSVLSEMGEIQNGVVLPGSIYNVDNPAPSTEAGVYIRRFKNGATITYDRNTGAMALDATSAGSLTLTAGGCTISLADGVIMLTAGVVTHKISGSGVDTQGGEITHDGLHIDATHKHKGVQTGAGISDVPVS